MMNPDKPLQFMLAMTTNTLLRAVLSMNPTIPLRARVNLYPYECMRAKQKMDQNTGCEPYLRWTPDIWCEP